ncbi:hypothetical protein TNCT_534041 [Trichonephila clavata]|uniref:Uncharacterized protein n=1 Tax=Trichonephila clavata TaxID=2740835 RepID=A0A8X6FLB1_TRICU|nr:hypothetical protein TNCT_534041 [Trichonephila clavata]
MLGEEYLEKWSLFCCAVGMCHESWNRNLNGKIKNIELKKEMSDKLKQLVNEIHGASFERIVGCGINTNMKLERWHRELKEEEVENVRDESVLIIDEDSNRLSREKEKEAILKEKEKSVVYEEPVELVYEGVERNMQLANDVKNMANAKETKRFDQALRNFMNYIGFSPF